MPLNMFYNTGIATYIWVLEQPQAGATAGQRCSSSTRHSGIKPLRKNLGNKNCELSDENIRRICDAFLAFEETGAVEDFSRTRLSATGRLQSSGHCELKASIHKRVLHGERDQGAQGRGQALRDGAGYRSLEESTSKGVTAQSAAGSIPGHNRQAGKPLVVQYEPAPDLRDTEQIPLSGGGRYRGVPEARGAALMRRTPGTCRRV